MITFHYIRNNVLIKLLIHSQYSTVQPFSLALNTGGIVTKIPIGHLRRHCFGEGPLGCGTVTSLKHIVTSFDRLSLEIKITHVSWDIMFLDLGYKANAPEMNI